MYVDTHAHMYLKDFNEDFDLIVSRCKESEVARIYMPNIDVSSIPDVKRLASLYPELFYPQMGLHPCYVKENYKEELVSIEKELKDGVYTAVGEIGIDLYWDKSLLKEQQKAFVTQIEWAKDLGLPIVIHSRESLEITIKTVSEMQNGDLTGVFHCYNGSLDQAKEIADLGFYVGIGGVLTFKNSGLDAIVKDISLDLIVLETDAPYLSPKPFRGKRNESSYLTFIGEKLAEIKELSVSEIQKITTTNANKLYQYAPL